MRYIITVLIIFFVVFCIIYPPAPCIASDDSELVGHGMLWWMDIWNTDPNALDVIMFMHIWNFFDAIGGFIWGPDYEPTLPYQEPFDSPDDPGYGDNNGGWPSRPEPK